MGGNGGTVWRLRHTSHDEQRTVEVSCITARFTIKVDACVAGHILG